MPPSEHDIDEYWAPEPPDVPLPVSVPAGKKEVEPEQYGADWEEHRIQYHSDLSRDEYLKQICSRPYVLPEHKLAPCLHLPCQAANAFNGQGWGWQHRPYLVVLPNTNQLDIVGEQLASLSSPGGFLLRQQLDKVGISPADVMFTSALRFSLQPGQTAYNERQKKNSAYCVRADAANIRPKVIITCGADALKAFFGRTAKVDTFRGSNQEWTAPDGTIYQIVPSASYLQFLGGYGDMDIFLSELRRAKEMVDGVYRQIQVHQDYCVIKTTEEFENLEQEIVGSQTKRLSFDTEFGNDVARDEFNYVLSAQLGWAPGKAAFIPFRAEFGKILHTPEHYQRQVQTLGRLLNNRSWRLAGHHLRTDVQKAAELGIDADERLADGEDTMLMHHLLHGDCDQGLDNLCRKYTPQFGAYWQQLEGWLDANHRNQRLRFGYRDIPWEILIPYSQKDADVTWRVAEEVSKELQLEPKLWHLYWDITTWTSLHLLDVERQGVLVDEKVRTELREAYQPELDALLREFRETICWPDFSPSKKGQVIELLYSQTNYKGKAEYLKKNPPPVNAKRFNFTPPFNTEKYPKEWTDLIAKGEDHLHTPSTKSKAIELLWKAYPDVPELKQLRQASVLAKFLNTYLKPVEMNEFGVPKAGKGFAENIWADGRVRSHFAQTSETGRYRSFACNLQTSPKKQEDVIFETFVDRRFGLSLKEYKYRCDEKALTKDGKMELFIPKELRLKMKKFKSVYIAPPGHYLIEIDFKTAEIAAWAYMSGDINLLKMIEQDRDMHCEIATRSFDLPRLSEMEAAIQALAAGDSKPYAAWKKWCKTVHETARNIAKSVVFG